MPHLLRTRGPRPRRLRAIGASAALVAVGLGAGLVPAAPASAASTPRVERLLGWVTHNNDIDDEFRLDLIIRVPHGELPTQVRYDGNYDGALDTTASLQVGPGVGQEYQIVSVVDAGEDDLITLSIRGDADYDNDCAHQPSVVDNHAAITVPSGTIDVTGFTTTFQIFDCPTSPATRPTVRIPWDNAWGSADGNSQDGWGAITTGGTLAADKAIVDATSWSFDSAEGRANCGITDEVAYQWYQESSPGIFTPVGSMTTTAVTPHRDNPSLATELGSQSFPGPGYYKLLAWPNAVSSDPNVDCTGRGFTPGNVAESYTVATVFNDYAPVEGAPAAHPYAWAAAILAGGAGVGVVARRRRRVPARAA